jgi:P4 family phage/plasmid primase-like protien
LRESVLPDACNGGAFPDEHDTLPDQPDTGKDRMSAPERGPAGTWEHLAFWADGAMALGMTQASLPADDLTAAILIAAERGGNGLHYATGTGQWHIWTGQAHPPDTSGEIDKIVINFAIRMRTMLAAAQGAVWEDATRNLASDASEAAIRREKDRAWGAWAPAAKYAAGLSRSAGRSSLVNYLASLRGVSDEHLIEARPYDLNFPSGTLDLATLEQRRHRQSDLITYVLDDPWNPQAQCPQFWDLVWRMTGRDYGVACYVIKLLGYSLLGDNREQKIIFINGPTGSGKSVLLHVVSKILGPLSHASGADLITVVRHGRNARTENSIRGKRLVTITETSKFMSIDEAQLKQLTGERVISVNQHYAKTEIRTPVTWTIWVATNDMPNLIHFDGAMRRRIIVIPGGPTIPEWEADPHKADKILSTERQGILALLVRGCAEYHRSGLGDMPDAVIESTEEYAAEQNTVANFVGDTLVLGGWTPGGSGIPQHQAWEGYAKWSAGSRGLGRNEFMSHLGAYPGVVWNKNSRRFENLAWNPDWATRVG